MRFRMTLAQRVALALLAVALLATLAFIWRAATPVVAPHATAPDAVGTATSTERGPDAGPATPRPSRAGEGSGAAAAAASTAGQSTLPARTLVLSAPTTAAAGDVVEVAVLATAPRGEPLRIALGYDGSALRILGAADSRGAAAALEEPSDGNAIIEAMPAGGDAPIVVRFAASKPGTTRIEASLAATVSVDGMASDPSRPSTGNVSPAATTASAARDIVIR